ncbi:MAG: oligosaccharide flippase family protein [Candidatus Methanomethylophilaceae archaeon]|nr:oligosaccharide flippase family protein [Candidatus Methanomethylophilaceae archaeon]
MEKTSLNVLTNVIRTVLMALIGILLVPYYLDTLGVGTYALIPLATTITSYILIVTDSMVSACSRYVVITIQTKSEEEAEISFNSAFFGILRMMLLMVPFALAFSIASPYVFGIPDINVLEVQIMFALIFLSALISVAASSINTVFTAYNCLYYSYIARSIYALVQVILIMFFFWTDAPSLIYIGVAYLLSSFILVAVTYACMRSISCAPHIRLNRYDSAHFKQMYSLGAWNIVQNFGSLLFIQMSLVLTNLLLGAEAQGNFSIVVSFISMVNTACFAISTSVTPLVFKQFSVNGKEGLVNTMRLAIKFLSMTMALPIAFVLIYSPEILETWVGSEYVWLSDIVRIAFLIQLTYCVSMIMGELPEIFLTVHVVGKVTLIFGLANIALAVIFVKFAGWGMTGIMIAWVCSMASTHIFRYIFNSYKAGSGMFTFLVPLLKWHIMLIMCTAVLYLVSMVYRPPATWLSIAIFAIVVFVVYFLLVYPLSFSNDEKRMVSQTIPSSLRSHLPSFIVGKDV